jgi:hypothetical protein
LLPASERSAVALDRSNHRWRVVSRSRTSPLIGTSAGPHSTYSRTDFVLKLCAKIVKLDHINGWEMKLTLTRCLLSLEQANETGLKLTLSRASNLSPPSKHIGTMFPSLRPRRVTSLDLNYKEKKNHRLDPRSLFCLC